TRDAAVVEIATPVALVLMPERRRALARWFRQELVVPELQRPPHELGAEGDHPTSKARLADLAPYHRRAALHDLEGTILLAGAFFPGPVEGELVLLVEDQLAVLLDLGDLGEIDGILNDEEPVFLEGGDVR